MMDNIPNLRVGHISTFFDNDLTYFRLFQDLFILLSFVTLTWKFFELYQFAGSRQCLYGVSVRTLILYSLTFTTRLAEYYPFTYLSYDFATCAGFAVIFWAATLFWIHLNSIEERNAIQEDQTTNNNNDEIENRNKWSLVKETDRPIWLHVTVACTAVLAYVYNYSHLQLTPRLFMWAWSHYLDAVAMVPQMWTLARATGSKHPVSPSVWTGVNLMVVSKVFQLLDWAYLLVAAEMLDVLAIVSASFHLSAYAFFSIAMWFYKQILCQTEAINDDDELDNIH